MYRCNDCGNTEEFLIDREEYGRCDYTQTDKIRIMRDETDTYYEDEVIEEGDQDYCDYDASGEERDYGTLECASCNSSNIEQVEEQTNNSENYRNNNTKVSEAKKTILDTYYNDQKEIKQDINKCKKCGNEKITKKHYLCPKCGEKQ